MKYKAGDKVRIKIWEKLAGRTPLHNHEIQVRPVNTIFTYNSIIEREIRKFQPDRVLEITEVLGRGYGVEPLSAHEKWETFVLEDWMIEKKIEKETQNPKELIQSRFEILDL